jgi:hypothetical protein
MSATLETAPVVMMTADGESREAKTWPDGTYACGFCETPVFSPEGWAEHERMNAECYARTGESYTAQPYADYHRRHYAARECPNPMCLVNASAERLAGIREDQRRRQEREDADAREEARKQARLDREQARKERAAELHGSVRMFGEQLGFAWCCTHTEPATSYGADPVMCEASGWDKAEYDAHMRGHGKKAPAGTKLIKLRRKPPAASLPKLPCDVLADVTWTEHHTTGEYPNLTTAHAERRGQFWALGDGAYSLWVLPYEPAPWETGSAAPVLVYAGSPGKFFTEAYSAKYDRR